MVLFWFWIFLGAESLQSENKIGDAGACSIGEGLKGNASVKELLLVSCGVGVCVEQCVVGSREWLFELLV